MFSGSYVLNVCDVGLSSLFVVVHSLIDFYLVLQLERPCDFDDAEECLKRQFEVIFTNPLIHRGRHIYFIIFGKLFIIHTVNFAKTAERTYVDNNEFELWSSKI